MPKYTVGATTVAAAAGAGYATFGTTAARRAFFKELGFFTTTATVSGTSVSLGTPANVPVPTTTIVPNPNDAADAASTALLGTAWAVTPPTSPTVFDRKSITGTLIGSGIIWPFTERMPLTIAKSAFKTLWNHGAAAGSILDMYWEYEE